MGIDYELRANNQIQEPNCFFRQSIILVLLSFFKNGCCIMPPPCDKFLRFNKSQNCL